jgi:hypothetical protein
MPQRRKNRNEHGQMVPIFALVSVIIFGVSALAIDLSVQTHFRRNLQNVTDSAALAGARDLPISPAQADRVSAVADALTVVHNSFPWTTAGSGWALTQASAFCSNGASCSGTLAKPAGEPDITVTVNTPPLQVADTSQRGDVHRLEVIVSQVAHNGFGGVIGQATGTDAASAVAYHFAANQPSGFALFSKTYVASGNQHELIEGNMYVARYIQPQAAGHSTVCAAPDSSGNPGYIVLGAAQKGDTNPPYQPSTDPGQADTPQDQNNDNPVVHTACTPDTSLASGSVDQSGTATTAAGCAAALPFVQTALTYNAYTATCEANPALAVPVVASISPPASPPYPQYCGTGGLSGGTYQPALYSCTGNNQSALTINGSNGLAPGIYEIKHNSTCNNSCYDLTISGSSVNLSGVTFYLEGGATIGIIGGVAVTQSPYNSGSGLASDGKYLIVSDNAGNPTLQLSNIGTHYTGYGAIWLPTGSVVTDTNAYLNIVGQALVGNWDVQSGDHPNPDVTYASGWAPPQQEVLRITG